MINSFLALLDISWAEIENMNNVIYPIPMDWKYNPKMKRKKTERIQNHPCSNSIHVREENEVVIRIDYYAYKIHPAYPSGWVGTDFWLTTTKPWYCRMIISMKMT